MGSSGPVYHRRVRIAVIGGGPAGLYFSILMKKARPEADILVVEKNPANVTWGWGVVFSAETMENFRGADEETYRRITETFARWDAIDVHFRGEMIRSGGHGFCGMKRMRLLEILQGRAAELGVRMEFGREVTSYDEFAAYDVLVGADGINSPMRTHFASTFEPEIDEGRAKFVWLGSTKKFDTFTFYVKENEHGLFQVHAYQFDADQSTFIVECDEDTWRRAGLDQADEARTIGYCEALFAEELDGARLLGNHSHWINFRRVRCKRWHRDNMVLIGDAAHTAHFSIGSGTKLAMEDAIELSQALRDHPSDVSAALEAYWDRRWLDVAKLQRAAVVSRHWFEEISRYKHFDPQQFTVSLLSRSKRITHGNLAVRDPDYVAQLDRWFAQSQGWSGGADEAPPPPMFLPLKLRGVTLPNRVVVSPMCMYSAEDGLIGDWHLVHLGSRALGGAGLLFAEMTMVSREGRISPGCAGMYKPEHVDAWKRVVDFVRTHAPNTKMGIQIGHAGRKGSTQRLWEQPDRPLPSGNWPLVSASGVAWSEHCDTPRQMSRADMTDVREAFVHATRGAAKAGFDVLELQFAHGYLLSSFISPISNRRTDEYGGSLDNRLRYPLEVLSAVREAWPEDRPLSVRISATDWHPDGLDPEQSVEVARHLVAAGCDLVDVSAGQTTPEAKPIYGRMFQTPFSDRIRNELGARTMAVGNIQSWDHVNTIIVSGRADLCALARPHLLDPYFTLHAAAAQGQPVALGGEPASGQPVRVPPQYKSVGPLLDRAAAEEAELRELRKK